MSWGIFGDSDDQIFVDDAALQRDFIARVGSRGGGPLINFAKLAAVETIPTKSSKPGLQEKKKKRVSASAVIILLAVLLPVCVYGVIKCIAEAKETSLLSEAQVMMEQGLYSDAEAYLEEEGDYSDHRTKALINICRAHFCYDKDNIPGAYSHVVEITSKDAQNLLSQDERYFCEKVRVLCDRVNTQEP